MNVVVRALLGLMLGNWILVPCAAETPWIELSNDLDGWQKPTGDWFMAGGARLDPKNPKRLVGEPGGGVMINGRQGDTENLVSRQQWGDVELSLEFMVSKGSNSGVKLLGVYEIQIYDSWKTAKPTGADCGGIYPRAAMKPRYHHIDAGIAPRTNAAKAPGEWQTLEIAFRAPRFDSEGRKTANARFEKVLLNGTLIHERQDAPWPTGHIWRDKEHPAGPLLLQADHGPVAFRKVRLRPLPLATVDTKTSKVDKKSPDQIDQQIARLKKRGFRLVDFHVHLKGGLTIEEALAKSRQAGIEYGIAANCGIGFPAKDDRGIEAFLEGLKVRPAFVGMQAEGREWPRLFSREAIGRFDYVFTDAMTIVDHRGRRARLWMNDEVDIPDPQAFMELLVKTTVEILDREPIHIYVNPTFLPEVIAMDYDKLWTPERLRRVIAAAARNHVAIEISNRYRLPKPAFIREAKQAGIKFTLGTNNNDRELGRCEYGLQMIEECGLTPEDMWMPKGK